MPVESIARPGTLIKSRRRFLSAIAGTAMGILVVRSAATGAKWQLSTRARPAVLNTEYGPVPYFVPNDPRRLVILAHGYPWPDRWLFDPFLLAYAQNAVRRWMSFARANAAILLVPAMGAGNFAGYREMAGSRIDADDYVNRLVDECAGPLIQNFDGRFVLHGHSAGGQFAARYLVVHPNRLTQAVLSAPSTYPFPDPSVPWPNGMASGVKGTLSGNRAGTLFSPDAGRWLQAASQLPVTVLVGSKDTQPRPASPMQHGGSRIERAMAWVHAMKKLAEANGRTSTVKLLIAPGLGHDEASMAIPAQRLLSEK
jgi:Alpha/beta hydrolase family